MPNCSLCLGLKWDFGNERVGMKAREREMGGVLVNSKNPSESENKL